MKIRIGHLSTLYHTSLLLQAQGNFDERLGADVEWRLMPTGPAIVRAFDRGELDLAYVGLPPAIIGIDQGVKIICVAGGHVEGTVMAGKSTWNGFPEIQDMGAILQQFRGRKIGVPGKGSIHDVILREAISVQGLEHEIEIVNYPWADLVTEAIVRDKVAAAVGTPALAIAVKVFAAGRILYPPSKLWPNNPSYGIVVHEDFLARETNLLVRFLSRHEEATAFIRNRPAEAARLISEFVAIVDEGFVRETLSLSPKYCAQLTDDYIASTMKFVPVLRKFGYIKAEVGQEKIFSRKLINRVHSEKDHYNNGIA